MFLTPFQYLNLMEFMLKKCTKMFDAALFIMSQSDNPNITNPNTHQQSPDSLTGY